MKRAIRRASACAFALALAACHGKQTLLFLQFGQGPSVGPVQSIDLQLRLAGRNATATLRDRAGGAITFPTDDVVEIASGAGALDVLAIACDPGGRELGRASGSVTIVAGASATLLLGFAAAPLDAGVALDQGGAADLATGDGSDLAVLTPDDMAANGSSPDLAPRAPLTITPAHPTATPHGDVAFTASGGSGAGYRWYLVTGDSGGSIDAVSGHYTAGPTSNVSDRVLVVDSLDDAATTTVLIPGVSIAPANPTVPVHGTVSFTASGGNAPYSWSLALNRSGSTISPSLGLYAAGSTGSVTDTVQVRDADGNSASVNILVIYKPVISPAAVSVPPRGTVLFSVSNGAGAGVFSLTTNNSGGAVSQGGQYTAGATCNVSDVVTVTDAFDNQASASISVGACVAISPGSMTVAPRGTIQFSASGGSSSGGYVWALAANTSGGSLGTSGLYTAGSVCGANDVVTATDSLGNQASVSVKVANCFTTTAAE